MDNKVLVITDNKKNETCILINKEVLKEFPDFDCIGSLILYGETVKDNWGDELNDWGPMARAIKPLGLDPDDYRFKTSTTTPNAECVKVVRQMFNTTKEVKQDKRYTFL